MFSEDESEGDEFDGETEIFLRPEMQSYDPCSDQDPYRRSSETVFDVRRSEILPDKPDVESDAKFVIDAINQSHESLRKLVSK